MSQAIAGYNATVEISTDGGATYNAVSEMQDDTLKIDTKMLNATSHSSGGWEESAPGNSSWTATLGVLTVVSDAAQLAIMTAIFSKSKVKARFRPYGAGTGKPQRVGDCYIQTAEEKGPTADLNTTSITLQGTGTLVQSTQ